MQLPTSTFKLFKLLPLLFSAASGKPFTPFSNTILFPSPVPTSIPAPINPYVLTCTTGLSAALCYAIWGTTCDIDGDVLHAATNVKGKGDCSDTMGRCECVIGPPAPAPNLLPVPVPTACLAGYRKVGAGGSCVAVPTQETTGVVVVTWMRTEIVTYNGPSATSLSSAMVSKTMLSTTEPVATTSQVYASQLTLSVTGYPVPASTPVYASILTLSIGGQY